MEDFGWVRKTNTNYIVLADKTKLWSGYGVPYDDHDPINEYKAADVEAYLKEHPEMEFFRYDDEPTREEIDKKQQISKLSTELYELETWFSDVYDIQVNQYQRCQRLGIEYTGELTIEELDDKAVKTASQIKDIRKQIEDLKNN